MTGAAIMSAASVSFAKQFNGYDREQVDRYIEKLAQAYQTAYEEYNAVCAKYNSLLENYKQLDERQERGKANAEVIAKALLDTETLAQKLIADAHAEADTIKTEAQAAVQKIKEDAYVEKAAAKIQAQKLIEDTQAEAAQIDLRARRNLEQADGSILQMIDTLQTLLTPKTIDIHVVEKQETPTLLPFIAANTGG